MIIDKEINALMGKANYYYHPFEKKWVFGPEVTDEMKKSFLKIKAKREQEALEQMGTPYSK